MSDLAQEPIPAWPAHAGSTAPLQSLWDELCAKGRLRRSDPTAFPTILALMDLSELMNRPVILMRDGWKRVRA